MMKSPPCGAWIETGEVELPDFEAIEVASLWGVD